jgi:hypothetical protein
MFKFYLAMPILLMGGIEFDMWNMIIFGFGFLIGGLTSLLIVGVFFLAKSRTPISGVIEPVRDFKQPKFSPRLNILSERRSRPSLEDQEGKAFS